MCPGTLLEICLVGFVDTLLYDNPIFTTVCPSGYSEVRCFQLFLFVCLFVRLSTLFEGHHNEILMVERCGEKLIRVWRDPLSQRDRATVRCFVSLNISLSNSRLFKILPYESLCTSSYSPSVVTMALSCFISEIKRNIGRKSRFFHTQ